MLTLDQIKNLKKGDKLVHEIRFIDTDGEYIKCSFSPLLSSDKATFFIGRYCVSLPSDSQSKYDPCRRLKEGDIVKPRFVDGRTDIDLSFLHPYTVTEGENPWGNVRVKNVNHSIITKAVFLQLISPVEELEPYTVDECGFAPTLYVRKNGKVYMTIPYKEGSSLFQTREEALAAAEAECERLNAEWRKKTS